MIISLKLVKTDILYELCAGTIVSNHYDFEISETINELITL